MAAAFHLPALREVLVFDWRDNQARSNDRGRWESPDPTEAQLAGPRALWPATSTSNVEQIEVYRTRARDSTTLAMLDCCKHLRVLRLGIGDCVALVGEEARDGLFGILSRHTETLRVLDINIRYAGHQFLGVLRGFRHLTILHLHAEEAFRLVRQDVTQLPPSLVKLKATGNLD